VAKSFIIINFLIINDESSSAKTKDEKELFFMKTVAEGYPKFTVMSLKEPEDAHVGGRRIHTVM
jgi:hypothetical protein